MSREKLVLFVMLTLVASTALSVFCFSTGRELLGAINASLAVVNIIMLAKL